MMRVAAHLQSDRATVMSPVIQTAHYDMAVVSTAGSSEASCLLVNGLTSRNLSTVLLDCAHSGDSDLMRCAAAKVLCLDDQLYRVNGGGEFARMSISAARRAGRATAMLCADIPTVFINRREILRFFWRGPRLCRWGAVRGSIPVRLEPRGYAGPEIDAGWHGTDPPSGRLSIDFRPTEKQRH